MSLGDIYYILFRRKWVILGVSLLGFIAAGVAFCLCAPQVSVRRRAVHRLRD